MKRTFLSLLLLTLFTTLASWVGQWRSYPYTDQYRRVLKSGTQVFVLKGNTLVLCDPDTWQPKRILTREDGLSSTVIVDACYSTELDRIALVYDDGMIDVLHADGSIWSIPDLYTAPMAGIDKTISSIRIQQNLLFIHTAYGFAIADIERNAVLQNLNLGHPVTCAWQYGESLFYSDPSGTYLCPRTGGNPYSPNGWSQSNTYHIIRAEILHNAGVDQCWLMRQNRSMCRIYPGEDKIWPCFSGGEITDLRRAGHYIMANVADSLVLFDTRLGIPDMKEHELKPHKRIACLQSSPRADGSVIDLCPLPSVTGGLALLYADSGVLANAIADVDTRSFTMTAVHPEPLTIDNHQQSSLINRLVTSPDGEVAMSYVPPLSTGYGSMLRIDGILTTVDPTGEGWQNYGPSVVTDAPASAMKSFCAVTSMTADPAYPQRYWYGTLENGIVAIDHGKFYARYDASTTNNGVEVCAPNCTRICGIDFSQEGDLWCFNAGHSYGLRCHRRADDKWYRFRLTGLEGEYGFTHLCVTRRNGRHQVWGSQQFKYEVSNVFCYDYGANAVDAADDRFIYFRSLKPDHPGAASFIPYYTHGIYEGPTGAIWLLNTQGIYLIDDPDLVFDQPGSVRQVMDNISPTSLAIDANQNVWVSTQDQGILLFTPDGRQLLAQYTSANSIMTSDEIQSVTFEPSTNTLWIASRGQILSYTYDPEDYTLSGSHSASMVAYCHPATVTRGATEAVDVFGLSDDATITVTNSQGRTVWQGTAIGGIVSIPTSAYPVGTYSVHGIDASDVRGELLTFEVVP